MLPKPLMLVRAFFAWVAPEVVLDCNLRRQDLTRLQVIQFEKSGKSALRIDCRAAYPRLAIVSNGISSPSLAVMLSISAIEAGSETHMCILSSDLELAQTLTKGRQGSVAKASSSNASRMSPL